MHVDEVLIGETTTVLFDTPEIPVGMGQESKFISKFYSLCLT